MEGQQFRASNDINTSVFVAIDADNAVSTAGAAAVAIGIMHESSWATPIPGADGDVAVPAGQSKRIYQENEVCEVRVGVGGLTAGDLVTPDAAGAGVVAAAAEPYSAICVQGGAADQRAKVVVARGNVPAAP